MVTKNRGSVTNPQPKKKRLKTLILQCSQPLKTNETSGIRTLIASGIVKDTKENMYRMLHNIGMTYLKGLGVKDSTLCDLS